MSAVFDRAAWFYDSLAKVVFGNSIRHSQIVLLPFIPAQASVLIVGGGTGWLLQDLATLQVPLKITYLELSGRMLARAQQIITHLPTHSLLVTFRQGTEADLLPEEIFDVIFTPFVLDLYSEAPLLAMVNKLREHLKPGGIWLVADFFIDPNLKGWQKWWRQRLTQIMYVFFDWVSSGNLPTRRLPQLGLIFKQLPLNIQYTRHFYHGFIRAQVYQNLF